MTATCQFYLTICRSTADLKAACLTLKLKPLPPRRANSTHLALQAVLPKDDRSFNKTTTFAPATLAGRKEFACRTVLLSRMKR
jgi:hypothetical protein